MPVSCCAVSCANRFSKDLLINFHRFPKEDERKKKWIRAVSRDKWELKDHHRICSDHFVSGKPSKDPNHIDYVPTVFNDHKRRIAVRSDKQRTEHVTKRRKLVEETPEAAVILASLSQPSLEGAHLIEDAKCNRDDSAQNSDEGATVSTLNATIVSLSSEIQELKEKLLDTRKELENTKFGVHRLIENDEIVKFYTLYPIIQLLWPCLTT